MHPYIRPLIITIGLSVLFFNATVSLAISEDELLDPNVAFSISGRQDGDAIIVRYDIAEGYYLYRHSFKFKPLNKGVTIGSAQIPEGKKIVDDYFGEVESYRNEIEIRIPYTTDGNTDNIEIEAESQGCADLGVCYPPQKQLVFIVLQNGNTKPLSNGTSESRSTQTPISEQDKIAASLAQGKTWLTVISLFGIGLLLAFTPCVFPMIPILSSIIVGQGSKITTRKAFSLSSIYVLAMTLTYTVAGVIVGMSGENVQALFQTPWILGSFAAVFVLLSLSMFGFYELQMPNAIQSKLSNISNSQQGGTYLGVVIMGFLSALIVGPCVTAPLIGVLIYIADSGDAVLGGLALFSLSLGMGAPLIIIGTSAGKWIPKPGVWMDAIKSIFGVLLLGVAVWLLERVLPIHITMIFYALLLIGSAIYMGALEPIKEGRSAWYRLWKAIGLVFLLYGTLLIIGASMGGKSLLQPLKLADVHNSNTQTSNIDQHEIPFKRVKGLNGLQQALQDAGQKEQFVMLDFYADWCISCKEMEAFTFTDPNVKSALDKMVLLQSDVTKNDEQDKELLKSLGLFGPPAILFYPPRQDELRQYRVVGYKPADEFYTHLQSVLAHTETEEKLEIFLDD